MKTVKNKFWAVPAVAMALCMSVVSCTSDEVMENPVGQPSEEERVPNRATMNLQGGLVPFDATTTRATTEEWPDGAKVYLQFTVGTSLIDGMATYDAETANWTVDYYGELTSGKEAKCEAYYFENTGTADHLGVALTEHSIIYEDKSAVYMFEDNTLTVIASLTPKTGRIRFKGEAAETYIFSGIKTYTYYDIRTNSFTDVQTGFSGTLTAEGITPYYYGYFPNESKKQIYFDDGKNNMTYTRVLGANALSVGRSGYLDIPTLNNRSGWSVLGIGENITVSGVTFKMINVVGGTFFMGSSYEQPIHSVTLTNYSIGETEVTQQLWQVVMGSNPSAYKGDQRPVEFVSWNDCQTFITKLNSLTGRNFRLPTEAEWEFAARGGNLSKGYEYSGSNTIGDVAWYTNNAGTNNRHQNVKTKAPNELGIYDMSGNVWEWCQDWYGSYSSGSQTDPTGPTSGSRRVYRGGSWSYEATCCRVAYRNYNTPSYTASVNGFRLAL